MIEENNETKLNEENEEAAESVAKEVPEETEENDQEQLSEEVQEQESEQLVEEDLETVKKSGTFVKFLKYFFASVVDTLICLGISVALLFAIDAILRATAGLFFVASQIYTVVLIIFAVVIVFYYSIFKTTTKGTTLGEKLLK